MLRSSLRLSLAAVTVLAAAAVFAPTAAGVPLTASAPVEASTTNPLAACPPDGSGVNFPGSEVEPWLEVNPVDPDNVVTFYQQDRYSDGGAKGNVAAVSFDGGLTWVRQESPTKVNLFALFIDKKSGWAVGGDGIVLSYER